MKKTINVGKIIANFAVSFFTTLGAAAFAGSPEALYIAMVNAVIVGGIAASMEFKNETDGIKIVKTLALVV